MPGPAPTRTVRSPLAAQRAQSRAGTTWGDVVAIPRAPRPASAAEPAEPAAATRVHRPAAGPGADVARAAHAPPRITASERTGAERRLLLGLVGALALFVLLLASLGVERGLDRRTARRTLSGALGRSAFAQAEFHARNRRFARIDELQRSGFALPVGLEVVRSSAGMSHWYLQLRDPATQVVCERIGELFDDPASEGRSACRDAAPAPQGSAGDA